MRLFLRKDRPHVGCAMDTLSEELDLPEVLLEEGLEFVEIEFVNMKRVVEMRLIRVQRLVGCGDQKQSIRGQESLGFAEQLVMIVNVLNCLEARDDVKSTVSRDRDVQNRADFELQI